MKIFIDSGREHVLTSRMLPYWEKLGVELVPLKDAQIHLSYVSFTVDSKIPKVLRLDGVYYDTATSYMSNNRPLIDSYRKAQGIIFQSRYSKNMTQRLFGTLTGNTLTKIIHNGGDPSWKDPKKHEYFNIVVASNWRRWKRLPEMISTIEEVQEQYPDVRLHVVGKAQQIPGSYIKWYGFLNHSDMRELYRKMDLAIHIAKREWCPNVVLEFLSSGIPTLVSDKGCGSAELLEKIDRSLIVLDDLDPDPLMPVPQYMDVWNRLDSDFKTNLQSKIQVVMHYGPKHVKLPEELTIEYVAKAYYDFMMEFI